MHIADQKDTLIELNFELSKISQVKELDVGTVVQSESLPNVFSLSEIRECRKKFLKLLMSKLLKMLKILR